MVRKKLLSVALASVLAVSSVGGSSSVFTQNIFAKAFDGSMVGVDVTQLDTAAESGGMYATNPGGAVGKEATITIDGSFSDWSEDMLIAQGGAWDIANNWKGGHENCVLDDYALYAAWDNDNLYIGWQMVNTTDTWASQGDGPLSDGGRVLDVPLMLAINVGNRPAMTGKMANGKLIWDALDVSFSTRVDNILLMSGKCGLGTPGYFIASDEKGGASYEPDYCLSFKTEGISYKMAEGNICKSVMMLENAQSPEDAYDINKYVDAMTKNHDTSYDSFYEINIPLKTLGIDKSYIEENGIGVMQLATRGTSAIDCIPHDPAMLDNATDPNGCAVDPSTSHEKDDNDDITVPLAAVGNMKAGGEGSGGSVKTPSPKTPEPTEEPTEEPTIKPTKEPIEETERPDPITPVETEVPNEDVGLEETAVPTKVPATAKPVETVKPTVKPTVEPTKIPEDVSDQDTPLELPDVVVRKSLSIKSVNASVKDGELCEKQSVELSLEAEGGTAPYKYRIQASLAGKPVTLLDSSDSNSILWTPQKAGRYMITYCVIDKDEDIAVYTKKYDVKKALNVLSFAANKTTVKKGAKISFTYLASSVFEGNVQYRVYLKKTSSTKKIYVKKSYSTANKCTWKAKKGTYKAYLEIMDGRGNKTSKTLSKKIVVK